MSSDGEKSSGQNNLSLIKLMKTIDKPSTINQMVAAIDRITGGQQRTDGVQTHAAHAAQSTGANTQHLLAHQSMSGNSAKNNNAIGLYSSNSVVGVGVGVGFGVSHDDASDAKVDNSTGRDFLIIDNRNNNRYTPYDKNCRTTN